MPVFQLPLLPATLRWLGVVAVAGTIAVYSLHSTAATGEVAVLDLAVSFVLHLLAYAGLAVTLAYATVEFDAPRRRRAVAVIVLAASFGLGIELLQGTTAERTASPLDALVNLVGASLALGWYALERRCTVVPLSEFR